MIITIARQCGSGGHDVASLLAEKLGIEIYDRQKFIEEAKALGKYDENTNFFNEKPLNNFLYSISQSYGDGKPMESSINIFLPNVSRLKMLHGRT